VESRQAWLLLYQGTPQRLAFGAVKNPSEEPDSARKPWAAAFNDSQEADPDWTATSTMWKRAPAFAMNDAASNAVLAGRLLTIAGVQWDLDDSGRVNSLLGAEKLAPDGLIIDQDAAVSLAESLGSDLVFVEKTTLKLVKVWAASDPTTPAPAGIDSALYRQVSDSQVVRVDN
jgi:hypothetical protein